MYTKKQMSLTRKALHGIVLIGVFLSAFSAGNLPAVRAQAAPLDASVEHLAENNLTLVPPTNDNFDTRELISATPYTNTQDTVQATTAVDDPILTCDSRIKGSKSVWYAFTPSVNGTLTANTETSNFDTLLALWTGTRGSLTSVACNDDFTTGQSYSQIRVHVQAGVTYFLEVAGYEAESAAPAKSMRGGDWVPFSNPIEAAPSGALNLSVDFNTSSSLCPGTPNGSLFTTQDNQDNAGTGVGDCDMDTYLFNYSTIQPIEFTINVPVASGITKADLLILNWDVDEDSGEIDKVYFNGHYAGTLVGANGVWSTTTLSINPAWIVTGSNLVKIDIDITGFGWAVKTDWGQLVLNNQGGTAFIRTTRLDKSVYNPKSIIHTTIEVDTSLASQNLRTEVNLRNSKGKILSGTNINHTVLGTSNDPILVNLTVPAGTPPGIYNIQVLVYDRASNRLQDSQLIAFTVKNPALTIRSIGAYDGWILESTETSNAGGTLNATATTFALGDDVQDKQYRAILSFNTAGLPDNATIIKVTLMIRTAGLVGTNPFTTHGSLWVDIRKPFFGTSLGLLSSDFQAASSKPGVGIFSATPTSNWYSAIIRSVGFPYINLTGTTQFRLRFGKDDNDDLGADYMKFISGNYATTTARPTLIVEYTVP